MIYREVFSFPMLIDYVKRYKYFFYLLSLSVVFMTVGSMTSFLFPIHVGVDQNCFFTIGSSVLDGKVLYRDIYDQKGPLLFFLHTLAALISRKTFIGVYFLEIINFTVILYFFGKISDLFLDRKHRNLVVATTGLIIVTAFCFSRGDNAEEFCMSFVVIALYHMLKYLNSDEEVMSYKLLLLHGFFASCILWIKFTMLGFYIGWCIIIGITILRRKDFKRAFISAMMFLLGIVIGTIPYLIYFIATDSMSDFIYAYFYTNIFMYSNQVTPIEKIQAFFTKDIAWNPVLMPMTLIGVTYFASKKSMLKTKEAKIGMVITYVLLYFFVFIGGTRYKYYLQIVGAFTVFGVIFFVKLLEPQIAWLEKRRKITLPICILIFNISLLLFSNCMPFFFKPREEYAQKQLADIINQVEDATLLNYNFLDGGFYLTAGTELPDTKFFCRQNFPREAWPELYAEQEAIIANQEVDFVIVRYGRGRPLEDFAESKELFEYYTHVTTVHEEIDDYYYALFVLNTIDQQLVVPN